MAERIHNLVIPDLDDKTFEELVDDATARIPIYAPGWTDHNLSDPGITFLDLFAWLAEMQIYRLNLLPDRNYLKFLKLLGEKPRSATPARIDLTFTAGDKENIYEIHKGTEVPARRASTDDRITFETDEDLIVAPLRLKKIVSFADMEHTDHTVANERARDFYYAFGKEAEEGSILYLGFEMPDSVRGEKISMGICLYEDDLPPMQQSAEDPPQLYPSAQLEWEYWSDNERDWTKMRLEADDTVSLLRSGRISFIMPSDIGKYGLPAFLDDKYERFWMRCRIVEKGHEIPPRIDTIRINVVSATQGKSIPIPEYVGRSSGLPGQKLSLQHKPIIVGTQKVVVYETWEAQDDFDASDPDDKHYLLSPGDGTLIFGDGVNGRIPPEGSDIMVSYRSGGGKLGNIPADAELHVYHEEQAATGVDSRSGRPVYSIIARNERPGYGGKDQESLEEAQNRVRKDLKKPYRAVVAKDYEEIAKETPGLRVARAHAVAYPDKNLVKVVVVPYSPLSQPIPGRGFLRTVRTYLDRHRLITTRILVIKPQYVQISVHATVRTKPRNEPMVVQRKIKKALDSFLSPIDGGPDRNGWPFGRGVYQSDIYAVIEGVDGVDCVRELTLEVNEEDTSRSEYQNGNVTLTSGLCLVHPGDHDIQFRTS